jgi:hypothetical protein
MAVTINGSTGISGVDGSAATPALQGGDTNTGIVFGTDTVGVSTGGVQRTTVDSSGRLLVGVGSATANGGVLELSGGITFPATAVAATNPNTLDDYEEGTWTPTVVSGITSPTYTQQHGAYTKIGNKVAYQIRILVSGGTGSGAQLQVGTLPFTSSGISLGNGTAAIGLLEVNTVAGYAAVNENSTTASFFTITSGNYTVTQTNTRYILVSGSYFIA